MKKYIIFGCLSGLGALFLTNLGKDLISIFLFLMGRFIPDISWLQNLVNFLADSFVGNMDNPQSYAYYISIIIFGMIVYYFISRKEIEKKDKKALLYWGVFILETFILISINWPNNWPNIDIISL